MRYFLVLFFLATMACTPKKSAEQAPLTGQALIDRGEQIYKLNCIACHNQDPKMDGSVGPDIAGSSLQLVEARVLRAEYPFGYKPKRETKTMQAIPALKDEIPALHAFLAK